MAMFFRLKIILFFLFWFNCTSKGMISTLPHIIQSAETAVAAYNASLKATENAYDAHDRIGTHHIVDHQTFSNTKMISDIYSDQMGINLNSPIDCLAHQIEIDRSSFVSACVEPQACQFTTAVTIPITHEMPIESKAISNDFHNATSDSPAAQIQSSIDASNIPSATHQEQTISGHIPHLLDRTSFDSRHAIESHPSYTHEQTVSSNTRLSHYSNVHSLSAEVRYRVGENISETDFYALILSKSDAPDAMSAQLSICTKDWTSHSKFTISEKTQEALRSFFFECDSKEGLHFIPVNTTERQGELIKILNPDIQKYYESMGDHQGYLRFLNTYAQKNIEQARYLHGIAKEGKDAIDHIESFSANTLSYLYSFVKSTPADCTKIIQSRFAQDLKTIDHLCKQGRIAEAEAYIDTRLRQRLAGGDHPTTVYNRTMSLRDHDNLCKIVENYKRMPADSSQTSLNQRALVSMVTQKIEKQELQDKIQNKNEAPVQNNQSQKGLDVHTIESQTSSPVGPNLKGPEKDNEKNTPQSQKDFSDLILNDKEYQEINQKLNKLKEEAPNMKMQDHETGIFEVKEWDRLEQESTAQYNNIRADLNDIDKVCENLGLEKNIVQKVKDHVFYNRHQLDSGIERFDPNLNIAESWKRISNNKYVRSDLEWFLHEFAESKIEAAFPKVSHRNAHDYVNTIHNWSELLNK